MDVMVVGTTLTAPFASSSVEDCEVACREDNPTCVRYSFWLDKCFLWSSYSGDRFEDGAISGFCLHTDMPTPLPTVAPSSQPTSSPTIDEPSRSPSTAPITSEPSVLPTQSPWEKPTEFPTQSPHSQAPTVSPSMIPSQMPSETPTSLPSKRPSYGNLKHEREPHFQNCSPSSH